MSTQFNWDERILFYQGTQFIESKTLKMARKWPLMAKIPKFFKMIQ